MSNYGENLREIRKAKGWSQEELAGQLGTTKQVISRYENDLRSPKISLASEYAEKLGAPIGELTRKHEPGFWSFFFFDGDENHNPDKLQPLPKNVRPVSDLHLQSILHIGSVAAGEPIYAPDDLGVYVNSPVDCDAALTVQGDSMTPTYLDGDIVYIKCRPDVPEGAVAVVFLDDEAILKHVYKRETGLTLWSDNPAYPPMMIEFEDYSNVRIFGVPVGYTRIYKKDPRKMLKKGTK